MVQDVQAESVLRRVPPERRRWIEGFRDRVREQFGPRLRDLRLYGSTVRGDEHEESDIDLLVLLDRATSEDQRAIWEIASSVSAWLQPRTFDFERYHSPISRASGFYKELRKESVRL